METKRCCRCGEELPATAEFFFRNRAKFDGFRHECKKCSNKYVLENKEKIREQRKDYRRRYKEVISERGKLRYEADHKVRLRLRLNNFINTYGVTEEYIQELMNYQRGCCAICGESLVTPTSKRSYNVDHDHETGLSRGLLCQSCNIALGLFYDKIDSLKSAIKYLRKYNAINSKSV